MKLHQTSVFFGRRARAKVSAAIVTAALALAGCAVVPAPPRQPNVLVIVADDLGYMDIGANNPATFYETPNIDSIAARGMRFTQAYAASSVCSPTRYSLLTGRYPTRAAATDWFVGTNAQTFLPAELTDRMPLEELTLAETLRGEGYATFFAGKWHLGPTAEYWPEAQGFDVNAGGHERGGPYGPGRYFTPYGNPRLADGPEGEHLPARLAAETINFMDQHSDQPFLAYLSFYSVHTPLMAPPDLVDKYVAKAAALGLEGQVEFADEEQVWPGAAARTVRILQSHATYAAMVEAMDRAVGAVLAHLQSTGLADDTVVVFTSDNGGLSTSEGQPTSNLPLRGGKGWLYEGGIREPFLVAWPGVAAAGAVVSTPVISNDLFPTLLEVVGGAPPDREIDGTSLVPLLRGDGAIEPRALFWHYPHYSNQGGFPGGAIRVGDWKLIERYEDGRVHLFNLADDAGERDDVQVAQPDRVRRMRAELHVWYETVGARFLRPHPGGPEPWRPAVGVPR
jgi:arylsulfatase A-like enzyme